MRGRYYTHLLAPPANLPGFIKFRLFKQGGHVNVFLAEMRFNWRGTPVPPDEEGEIFHGRFERYTDKRKDALEALEKKSIEVLEQREGKVLAAKVYRVTVKLAPAKTAILALLNKEGVAGNAHLIWEHKKPAGTALTIGGSENEPAAEE